MIAAFGVVGDCSHAAASSAASRTSNVEAAQDVVAARNLRVTGSADVDGQATLASLVSEGNAKLQALLTLKRHGRATQFDVAQTIDGILDWAASVHVWQTEITRHTHIYSEWNFTHRNVGITGRPGTAAPKDSDARYPYYAITINGERTEPTVISMTSRTLTLAARSSTTCW